MLLNGEFYSPYIAPAKNNIPKDRVLTPDQALAMLRKQGYIINDAVPAA